MSRRHLLALSLALTLVPFGSASAAEDPLLEAVGVMSGAQLYLQFMYIGTTADAYASKLYTAKRVRTMMEVAPKLLASVSNQLEKVSKLNLAAPDKAFTTRALAAIERLDAQGRALHRYAGSGTAEDEEAYERARKAAFGEVSALLSGQTT